MNLYIYFGKIAAHSAYEMFSWYKYLIVSLVFSHLGFWSGSLFLIAPFPDLCLLVLFYTTGVWFIVPEIHCVTTRRHIMNLEVVTSKVVALTDVIGCC